jgi:hypothetical protein
MVPWEVAAREALRDLVAAYAHAADRGRFDDLCALFAPDGVLELDDGRTLRGRDAVHDFLDRTRAALHADTVQPLVRHHVSSLQLTVEGPESARGAAYFLVVTERGPDHWGQYRDRFACVSGHWRFAHRRVRVDGVAPGSWAAERRAR